MSSAFADADVLERGTNTNQVPPIVAEAASPEVGQIGNGRASVDQSSTMTTSSDPEHELNPGQC